MSSDDNGVGLLDDLDVPKVDNLMQGMIDKLNEKPGIASQKLWAGKTTTGNFLIHFNKEHPDPGNKCSTCIEAKRKLNAGWRVLTIQLHPHNLDIYIVMVKD